MSIQKWVKAVGILVIFAVMCGTLSLWYETVIVGNYFASAGIFLNIMAIAAPVIVVVVAFFLTRFVVKFDSSNI